MHTMDYINAATTRTLPPHILPITDLKQMLSHIEEDLQPTMHLPVVLYVNLGITCTRLHRAYRPISLVIESKNAQVHQSVEHYFLP